MSEKVHWQEIGEKEDDEDKGVWEGGKSTEGGPEERKVQAGHGGWDVEPKEVIATRSLPIEPPPGPCLLVRPVPAVCVTPLHVADRVQASLGVLADVQYGDKPNFTVDHRVRYYRDAKFKLTHALQYFIEVHQACPLRGVLHLGDIVDANWCEERTLGDFEAILREFEELGDSIPQWHVIGNHCLDVGRPYLTQRLFGGKHHLAYYEVQLSEEWRMCVLDTTEVGVDGATSAHRAHAKQWQSQNWRRPEGQHWNSMPGDEQMEWLRGRILASRAEGKHMVVAGHHPVHVLAADMSHVAWEHERLCGLFEDNCDVVKAYFAGHWHCGGYVFVNGVHHVTWVAIVEAWDNAFAVVDFYSDRICIKGHGAMFDAELPIRSFVYDDADVPDHDTDAVALDFSAGCPVVRGGSRQT